MSEHKIVTIEADIFKALINKYMNSLISELGGSDDGVTPIIDDLLSERIKAYTDYYLTGIAATPDTNSQEIESKRITSLQTSLQSENERLRAQVEELLAVNQVMRDALKSIARGPLKPIPDPVAHSWESFAKAWMAHATDCKFIAIDVLKQKEGV